MVKNSGPFARFRQLLPRFELKTIFDVGANTGQLSKAYRLGAPAAEIYAFEPVGASFSELARLFEGDPQVHALKLALGDEKGTATISAWKTSKSNRIVAPREGQSDIPIEVIEIVTGDDFCRARAVDRISFL